MQFIVSSANISSQYKLQCTCINPYLLQAQVPGQSEFMVKNGICLQN